MAPRPTHIPHNVERTALQKMSPTRGLTTERLYPAGSQRLQAWWRRVGSKNNQTAEPIASRWQAIRR